MVAGCGEEESRGGILETEAWVDGDAVDGLAGRHGGVRGEGVESINFKEVGRSGLRVR